MSLRTRLRLIGVTGLALAGVGTCLIVVGDSSQTPALALSPFIMLSFIGVGLFAWWRRPSSSFGALTAVGFVFFLSAPEASDDPLLFSVGVLFDGVFIGTVVHMILAFPSGRLESRHSRLLVGGIYALLLVANVSVVLLDALSAFAFTDPHPLDALAIWHAPEVGRVILDLTEGSAIAIAIALLALLGCRWRHATAPQRRSIAPVLWTGTVFIDGMALCLLLKLVGFSEGVLMVPNTVALVCLLALPYMFLVSLGRRRWFRADALGSLVERLNDPARRGALRDALPMASATDRSSSPIGCRGTSATSATTARPCSPAARRAAGDDRGRARRAPDQRAVARRRAAGGPRPRPCRGRRCLALENERLEAELRARVEELEQSRKVIEFGMSERRRLERDLHDGAQQRLVALSLQVGMARAQLESDPEGAGRLLDHARAELRLAQEELRELARGIHPAILTDRGLEAAVDSLVRRAPVPVDVVAMPAARLPSPVEAVAYFVVAESLTNVAKYARARAATVSVARVEGMALVEVRDDGVGGADPLVGSGLRGLADRLAAHDGRLEIHSPPGRGTLVFARIPCASS